MNLAELNQGDNEQARIELLKCCGSSKWVNNILAVRPFSSKESIRKSKLKMEKVKVGLLILFLLMLKLPKELMPLLLTLMKPMSLVIM